MKKSNLFQSTELNQNSNEAAGRAAKAAVNARKARIHRDITLNDESVLNDWSSIMSNSPVKLCTGIFLLVFIFDLLISWELYQDMLAATVPIMANTTGVLICGITIAGAAGYISHLIAKHLSDNEFDRQVYNYQVLHKKDSTVSAIAVEHVLKDSRKDLLIGLILGALLIAIIALISFQRSWLVEAASGEDDYSLLTKVLPIFFIILEIFVGIYLAYIIDYTGKWFHKWSHTQKFDKCRNYCSYEDRTVVSLSEKADKQGETYIPSKEMADSTYRFLNRSQSNIHYVDEIFLKNVQLQIVGSNNKPVSNAQVVGVLSSGSKVGAMSNQEGNTCLYWETEDNQIEKIVVNNTITQAGPFLENTKNVISINETETLLLTT